MTSLKPILEGLGRASSQDLHNQSSLTLGRSPRPYHRRGESLTVLREARASQDVGSSSPDTPPQTSRAESSESGTEADDEKGPFLKGLPAPPLRSHKGLRGSSPSDLTPIPSPPSTPPAYVEADGYEYFKKDTKSDKALRNAKLAAAEYETYKTRKRKEVVRRCTELSLLWGIGAIVWTSRGGSKAFVDWLHELISFLLIPPFVYLSYPVRLALCARRAGKTVFHSLQLGFHIPSRFDPGPLMYPVLLPLWIAMSLFSRSTAFLPAAIACGLSSIPTHITATPKVPAAGSYLHWLISILPFHMKFVSLIPHLSTKPLSLKLSGGSGFAVEDVAVIFPLHHTLLNTLGYLTTSSLDISELHLLSTALINLLIFAHSPQAEIIKALIWIGGLCLFITCKDLMVWEVALARVPTWKLLRSRKQHGIVSRIDQAVCVLLTRARRRPTQNNSSDSDSDEPNQYPRLRGGPRPRLKLQMNGKTSTMPVAEPVSAFEVPTTKSVSIDLPNFTKRLRRNTFTGFGNGKREKSAAKKARMSAAQSTSPFLSFSLEQARVRKWAYAGLVYLFVAATVLGPVRSYVSTNALGGHEPFGWALGYLFGNIPRLRFLIVSNNLERWIALPANRYDTSSAGDFSIEYLRQQWLGAANVRLLMCVYCVSVLLVGLFAVLRLTSVVEVDTRRKIFHGIMVAMLLPTIFVDPCFIALALGLILAIFLLLDLFRASQLPPISKPLTSFLAPYVDGRDHRGPVIVSHIFLLIGCAIPLWLSLAAAPRDGDGPWAGWETPVRDISMISGVVCVGMGDAAASLIGRRYGRTKWYWAGGKSLEGSIAFSVAVTIGLMASWIWLRLGGWVPWPNASVMMDTMGKCAVAGLGASLLESTLTAANDNVVVPIGLWLLVRGLQI
ncbi:hypothetical protein B0A52_10000 [Exophiala mesophila]|uniref:dolichol kinase n=1 Tax=Exophiala mesophila TaxID=212818 RepID=A0A438MR11_EXOME|nr:hypothetical protein B0A52_10000 [Exophiala mesophila]